MILIKRGTPELMVVMAWLFFNLFYGIVSQLKENFIASLGLLVMEPLFCLNATCLSLYLAWQIKGVERLGFLFFSIAFGGLFVSDTVYHLVLQVLKKEPTLLFVSFTEIPYFLFLIFQFLAWLKLTKPFSFQRAYKHYWFFSLPSLIVIAAVFTLFMKFFHWEVYPQITFGIYEIIALILALFNYYIIIFVLSTAREKNLIFIALGLLILILIDLMERFSTIKNSEDYLGSFHPSVWASGELLICYALYKLIEQKDRLEENFTYSHASLQISYTAWCYLLCVMTLLAFFLFCAIFLVRNNFMPLNSLIPDLIVFIILFPVLTIISSNFFAKKMLSPLKKVHGMVHYLVDGDLSKQPFFQEQPDSPYLEINQLESAIWIAVEAISEKHQSEQLLLAQKAQLAHDIRSPLVALNVILQESLFIPEMQRNVIRSAIQRINDIAHTLLAPTLALKEITHKASSEPFFGLIDSIFSEKRVQYTYRKEIELILSIEDTIFYTFICVHPLDFKRVFSNLIDNAVESIAENKPGKITLKAHLEENNLHIELDDTGCGIKPALLPKILKGGLSVGKKGGNGLGISFSMEKIESWGGSFNLFSEEGKGTRVMIQLPTAREPAWFVKELYLPPSATIVVIDDDESIHQVWKSRLQAVFSEKTTMELIHFYHPLELKAFCFDQKNKNSQNTLYFVDYEYHQSASTGLDLIQEYGIANKSYLVTSRYEDEAIRKACLELGTFLLPKPYCAHIPLKLLNPKADLILIDDDPMLIQTWELKAKLAAKQCMSFSNYRLALNHLHSFNPEIPIYVDSHLNETIRGEEVAKSLYNSGYKNIYLQTGYSIKDFESMDWIKAVINKDPPF